MRIIEWTHLLDAGNYTESDEYSIVEQHLREAINNVIHPPGNENFTLNPTRKGNGVKPIKDGFTTYLVINGWELEARPRRFDAHYTFDDSEKLPFAVEWETGNISSSHRAINRIALAILENQISGGILVVPSFEMYKYLTDRIGNARELKPYYNLWRAHSFPMPQHYLGVVVIEHDDLSADVPLIKKGTDGRALI